MSDLVQTAPDLDAVNGGTGNVHDACVRVALGVLFNGAMADYMTGEVMRNGAVTAQDQRRAGGAGAFNGWRPSVLTECGSGDGPAQIKRA